MGEKDICPYQTFQSNQPNYQLISYAAIHSVIAYMLRSWHKSKEKTENQNWQGHSAIDIS